MAIKSNIYIDQGTDFEVTINVKDANSAIIALSGYSGAAQLRKHFTSSNAHAFAVTVSANTGEVTLAMNAAVTSTITAGRYLYDCKLISNNNIVTRLVEGIATITPQVTR